jgi:hypothetical protein
MTHPAGDQAQSESQREPMRSCIEACNDCAVECDRCAAACLAEEDLGMLARCIALDLECAELCRTSVILMSRGSDRAAELCGLCAEACEACAEECERHEMEHCRRCAKACRDCAQECRRMAGGVRKTAKAGRTERAAH